MASIRRYTTPTQELIVEGVDLTASDVYVVYKQGNTCLKFSGEEIEMEKIAWADLESGKWDTVLRVYMSQETTAKFRTDRDVEVQVNWIEDGQRNATTIARFEVTRNLMEEVIGNE